MRLLSFFRFAGVSLLLAFSSLPVAAQAQAQAPSLAAEKEVLSPEALARDPRVVQALSLLTAWVDSEQVTRRLPGVSMAVVHDQQLLWSRGFGNAHVETKAPATPTTMYSICSISKLFTSIAVMQQRDAGKLRLDDPVVEAPAVVLDRRDARRGGAGDDLRSPHPLVRPPARDRHPLLDGAGIPVPARGEGPRASPAAGDALPARDVLPVLEPRPHARGRGRRGGGRQAVRRADPRRASSSRSG